MKYYFIQITASLIMLSIFSGCGVVGRTNIQPTISQDDFPKTNSQLDPEVKRHSEAMYHILLGELSAKKDNVPEAIKNFEKASQLSELPSPTLHVKLAELELRAGNLNKALIESGKARALAPDNPKILLLHAGILEAQNSLDEAVALYHEVISKAPHMVDPHMFLAGIYIRQNKGKEAIAVLKGYSTKHPEEPVIHFYLARALDQEGNTASALEEIKAAYKLRPDNDQLAFEYIRLLLKAQKFDAIKDICEEILKRDPDNQLARKIMAQILMGEKKFDDALTHYKLLESVEDDATDTRFKIALIQIERRNYEDAVRELHLVLATKKDFGEARYALATALAGLGHFSESAEELFRVKKSDPLYSKSRTYASFLFRQIGDLKQAEKAIRDALHVPDDASIANRLYLVTILREAGKLEEALRELNTAINLDPHNFDLQFERIIILDEMNKKKEVLLEAEKLLALNPNKEELLNFIAYNLAQQKKDLTRAETLARKATETRPSEPYFLDTLGWILVQQERFTDALPYLKQSASAVPHDAVLVEHYAIALEKAGRKEEAKDVYTNFPFQSARPRDKESRDALERIKSKNENQ